MARPVTASQTSVLPARPKRTDLGWPMYFARQPLLSGKVMYRVGDAFQLQDKGYIRGLGVSYGITDAWTRPFSELPYVLSVNVRDARNAYHIQQQGLRYEDVLKLIADGAEAA